MIDSQQMSNLMWNNHVKTMMPEFVRVIGRVIGAVTITDINKSIIYNQVVDIEASTALKSNDLRNAIRQRWVEIIQGKDLFTTNETYTTPTAKAQPQIQNTIENPASSINVDEVKNLIVQTTRDTLKDVISTLVNNVNNAPDVEKLAEAVANKIKMPEVVVQSSNQGQEKKKNDIDDISQNVFIDVQDAELKSNINENGLGIITQQKDESAKDKIKKLKKLKNIGKD